MGNKHREDTIVVSSSCGMQQVFNFLFTCGRPHVIIHHVGTPEHRAGLKDGLSTLALQERASPNHSKFLPHHHFIN